MMAGFSGLEDNWGLQAIVGGSFSSAFCTDSAISASPNSCYGLMEMPKDDHHLLSSFPDLFETAAMLTDELEGLYKPFYPVSDSLPSVEDVLASSISVPGEIEEKPEETEQKQICGPVQSVISSTATAYVPKYKRRKNQHKRVVHQVTAEDLSSDMWAWRKYGQKPIKGSPYPRSYYRCSSSKGCLARKQVEQSCTDPSIFIITYTAEHSHSQPTRKNALAGTIRQKFPNLKSSSTGNSKAAKAKHSGVASPTSSSAVLSPQTPLNIASIDNEFVKQEIGIEEIGEQMIDGSDDNVIFPDIKLDDDFFSGLEDLDELISEFSNGHCSSKQFPIS